MERLEADTGIVVGGPCEIRQKLYRSGISPRSYFAQGGDAYQTSKFFQNPFSSLVDLLPVSNHVLRLIPTNLDLSSGGRHVFIYDLTSFTSLFHEFLPFLRALAEFCLGYEFVVWHARLGEVSLDLGVELHRYADVNASGPAYSAVRAKKWGDEVFYHQVAGFLGVYGNLMICTFLHACVVLAVVGDARKVYVAGDDGGAVLFASLVLTWKKNEPPKPNNHFYDDINILFYALALLGLIQWSKVFTTLEEGAIALKRPLRQQDDKLYQPQMIVWPSIQLLHLYKNWSTRDIRYPTLYQFSSRQEVRGMSCGEITRFSSNVFHMSHRISPQELQSVHSYLTWMYEQLGLRIEGNVPQLPSKHMDKFYPLLGDDPAILLEEPMSRTIRRLWQGSVSLPARVGQTSFPMDIVDDFSLYPGMSFVGVSNPLRSWLKKLQYIHSEPLFEVLHDEPSLQLLLDEYDDTIRSPPRLYRFHVISIPYVLLSH